ncbi:hypothetical protein TraAM80_02357 [Trypanosoma rangeli]|uniref:Uncharacterized protein n=1 Tax=Trypanosoma rangeli TaxID=5698 RepID=A0A3S5IRU8_TRYRA|nr:uncharacterized protein TraAM80_02357 [Trypanosoma rangeli]RNF08950.1 hypothetical protein TraAM80_02357 [Trypanosoma rangeli]|eukprot:RNF08950.1 hypothetical protein TraAM80_02357 [Trypanosoma rangeli]
MSVRDELVGKLTAALAEVQRRNVSSSNITLDSKLLEAVADYIEQGVGGQTTLQRLHGVLLQTAAASEDVFSAVERSGSVVAGEVVSLEVSAEELGRRRAGRLLAQALALRFR